MIINSDDPRYLRYFHEFSYTDDIDMLSRKLSRVQTENAGLVKKLKKALTALDNAGLEIPHGCKKWWRENK